MTTVDAPVQKDSTPIITDHSLLPHHLHLQEVTLLPTLHRLHLYIPQTNPPLMKVECQSSEPIWKVRGNETNPDRQKIPSLWMPPSLTLTLKNHLVGPQSPLNTVVDSVPT